MRSGSRSVSGRNKVISDSSPTGNIGFALHIQSVPKEVKYDCNQYDYRVCDTNTLKNMNWSFHTELIIRQIFPINGAHKKGLA